MTRRLSFERGFAPLCRLRNVGGRQWVVGSFFNGSGAAASIIAHYSLLITHSKPKVSHAL